MQGALDLLSLLEEGDPKPVRSSEGESKKTKGKVQSGGSRSRGTVKVQGGARPARTYMVADASGRPRPSSVARPDGRGSSRQHSAEDVEAARSRLARLLTAREASAPKTRREGKTGGRGAEGTVAGCVSLSDAARERLAARFEKEQVEVNKQMTSYFEDLLKSDPKYAVVSAAMDGLAGDPNDLPPL